MACQMMAYRQPVLLFITLLLAGCAATSDLSKVDFSVDQLNSEGLQGPTDGLRALSYEFCIPASLERVNEVMAIDKTLVVYRDAPGRVGCTKDQYLAVGNTAQDEYLEVLKRLSGLNYIKKIQEVFFE